MDYHSSQYVALYRSRFREFNIFTNQQINHYKLSESQDICIGFAQIGYLFSCKKSNVANCLPIFFFVKATLYNSDLFGKCVAFTKFLPKKHERKFP